MINDFLESVGMKPIKIKSVKIPKVNVSLLSRLLPSSLRDLGNLFKFRTLRKKKWIAARKFDRDHMLLKRWEVNWPPNSSPRRSLGVLGTQTYELYFNHQNETFQCKVYSNPKSLADKRHPIADTIIEYADMYLKEYKRNKSKTNNN